ncbi:MAG: sugar isomerase domain-containing protein [Christensenellales bacterium]|jgi:uncharacterized phosphosugar-binding protein
MKSDKVKEYLDKSIAHMQRIYKEERQNIDIAARVMANHIENGEIIHIYGPGGHSGVAAMEIFSRAGGLACINAILDFGTLLTNGGNRSMQVERLPGYGRIVIQTYGIKKGELLILVNSYGINAALIDAALTAKEMGVEIIGVSSIEHAENTPLDHPARHPSKKNLHDIVDYHIDTKVPTGDAIIEIQGAPQNTGAISSFANGFALHALEIATIQLLAEEGKEVPVMRSGNCTGGDEWNAQYFERFQGRIAFL